jgi:hypothetical protein
MEQKTHNNEHNNEVIFFDKESAYMNKILDRVENQILEDFGKDCKTFEEGCCICDAWKALRNLRRLYEPYEPTE